MNPVFADEDVIGVYGDCTRCSSYALLNRRGVCLR
ncbi:unnamed protein product, partial [marine sediment metagenome]